MRNRFIYLLFTLILIGSCDKERPHRYGPMYEWDNTAFVIEEGEVVKKQDYTINIPSSGDTIKTTFFVEDSSNRLRVVFIQDAGEEWLGYKDYIDYYALSEDIWDRRTLTYKTETGEKTEVTGIVYPVSVFAKENKSKKDRCVICCYNVGDKGYGSLDTLHTITVIQKGRGK